MKTIYLVLLLALITVEGCLFVSPTGNTNGNGTETNPFPSIGSAAAALAGSTKWSLCLLEGAYSGNTNQLLYSGLDSFEITGSGKVQIQEQVFLDNITLISLSNVQLSGGETSFFTNSGQVILQNLTYQSISGMGEGKNGCSYDFQSLSCSTDKCEIVLTPCVAPDASVKIKGLQITKAYGDALLRFLSSTPIYLEDVTFENNNSTFGIDCGYCKKLYLKNIDFLNNTAVGKFPFIRLASNFNEFDQVWFSYNKSPTYFIGPLDSKTLPALVEFDLIDFNCNSIQGKTSISPVDPSIPLSSIQTILVSANPKCPFTPCTNGQYDPNQLGICYSCPQGQYASSPTSEVCQSCGVGHRAQGYECVTSSGFWALVIILPIVGIVIVIGSVVAIVKFLRKGKGEKNEESQLLAS